MIGALLAFVTPYVTLSLLVTTPEAWVPALGDAHHGFSYLSGPGRLVVEDIVLLADAWLIIVNTARALLAGRGRSAPRPESPQALRVGIAGMNELGLAV